MTFGLNKPIREKYLPVSLIKHHIFNTIQLQIHLNTEVNKSSWCGKDDIRVGVDTGELFLNTISSQDTRVG